MGSLTYGLEFALHRDEAVWETCRLPGNIMEGRNGKEGKEGEEARAREKNRTTAASVCREEAVVAAFIQTEACTLKRDFPV